jgi:hypothetical protein
VSTRRHIRDLTRHARSLGITGVRVVHRGKHPAICGTAPTGKAVRVHISLTPSDRYTVTNAKRDIARAVRT